MRRWHSPREHAIMLRRWREEIKIHGLEWDDRCTLEGREVCHCLMGMGFLRKATPYGCPRPRCGICHENRDVYRARKHRERREAIAFELSLMEGEG